MRFSELFTKTTKDVPSEEIAINAKLLAQAGFIYKNSAGIYSFLPLGWRVIQKIANIIREEMNAIGGQEMLMPALVEKKYLDISGRWNATVGFKVLSKRIADQPKALLHSLKADFVLGWTHEEVLAEVASKYISSYKDLPFAAYQIQTKFRNEPRVKSGLLRGREFLMKDLYSFHVSQEDMWHFYDKVKKAYFKIFERCGLKSIYTLAAGGDFTVSNTHEFQVLALVGEDTIYFCSKCQYAENKEISKLKAGAKCPKCSGKITEEKSVEIGNIFPLGTKYSKAFNLQFTNEAGKKDYVVMASYGIGLGRVMGTVVEVHHDKKGIIWPESVAPYKHHLLTIETSDSNTNQTIKNVAEKLYKTSLEKGIEILYDDTRRSAGEKLADADLIGIPTRLVLSEKTLKTDSLEFKKRDSENSELIKLSKFKGTLRLGS